MLCKITKSLLFQNFGGETSSAGDVLAVCGVLSAPSKKQGCDGSLARYLNLIVSNLFSLVFSGLGDFWGEKSSSGVWGEAP